MVNNKTRTQEALESIKDYQVDPEAISNLAILQTRQFHLFGDIDEESVKKTLRVLKTLIFIDKQLPITLEISSYGGEYYPGMALVDYMMTTPTPIRTLVSGYAMSMGAIISVCGEKGHRKAYRNARFMFHENASEAGYQKVSDMEVDTQENRHVANVMAKLVARQGTLSLPEARQLVGRKDMYLTPHDVKRLGLVDTVLRYR